MDKIEDIAEGLSKAYNVKFVGMDTPGQDKSKRKIMKTFADIAGRWPKSVEKLTAVEFRSGFGEEETLAHVQTAMKDMPGLKKGEMILRFKRSDSETAYDQDLEDQVQQGWSAPNTNSVEGTMYHELAHVLSTWSEEEVLDELGTWLGEYYADNDKIEKPTDWRDVELIKAMRKEASGYSFRYDTPSGSIKSTPQAYDHHEFTSEAFSDAEINGDNAWGLSKFIHGKMIEVFDKYAK